LNHPKRLYFHSETVNVAFRFCVTGFRALERFSSLVGGRITGATFGET